jgi:hypothetical protein
MDRLTTSKTDLERKYVLLRVNCEFTNLLSQRDENKRNAPNVEGLDSFLLFGFVTSYKAT